MKKTIFILTLLISLNLQSQILLQNDTIPIKEVEIRGKKDRNLFSGFKIIRTDSLLMNNFSQFSLADLISGSTEIHVKNYNPGGLATASFRGTGASHTQIAWNNINLNNPMIGQFDLSLVPAGLIDDIELYYGAASMLINSGGLGGMIDLKTNARWDKNQSVLFSPGIGSFGRYSGLLKIKAGKKDFQSVTKAFYEESENNYRYLNNISGSEPYWEKRKNSQFFQKAMIQELYFRNPHSNISARFWYQSASRNLPVPIISQTLNPPEKQNDESFRGMISYESRHNLTEYTITAAYIADNMEYSNKLASVNSINKSDRILFKGEAEKWISNMTKIKIDFNNELNFVHTNNYNGQVSRNIASVNAIVLSNISNWLATSLLVRETLLGNNLQSPDFSIGSKFKPFRDKLYYIKACIAKNSKIPTLNDLYWMPGGNPDLKNETGVLSEISFELTDRLFNSLRLSTNVTFFRNHLTNLIQWHPGEFSYWVADNINNIITTGFESRLDINYLLQDFSLGLNAGYVFTRAVSESSKYKSLLPEGKQIIYIPVNQANIIIMFNSKRFYTNFTTIFTGRKYITSDNSQCISQYSISNLNAGIRLKSRNVLYNAGFIIENIFNTNYQNIVYYPMPGRNYRLSLIFKFNK